LLVVKPMFDKWREEAIFHLEAGWQYTMGIPVELTRLRMACVWPIWIGLRTLALLKLANPLSVAERVKVTRGEVYRIMARSVWWRANPARLDAEYQRILKQAQSG
jgi:farnesyl-diphosphate farnesyltransferase